MGGSSSSSKQVYQTDERNIAKTDNRLIDSDTANIGGNVDIGTESSSGDIYVTSTDQGAVTGGLDVALKALDTGGEILSEFAASNADYEAKRLATTSDTIRQITNTAQEANKSETSQAVLTTGKYLLIGLLGTGALIVLALYMRKGK